MRERSEQILRLVLLVLAALLVLSVLRAGCRAGALIGAKIPAVPTLVTHSAPATNSPAAKGTNVSAPKFVATNGVKPVVAVTNALPATTIKTNATNVLTAVLAATNRPDTNVLAHGTNLPGTNILAVIGTNRLTASGTNSPATNAPAKALVRKAPTNPGAMGAMNFGGMPGQPGRTAPLPAAIQTRVDKIVDSELFAPVMRPQPMALLGIAGETVFLRTASGQTGLLKADEPLEGVKLLRIGINRVLVEVDGQKKELTIFDGNGSESLLESTK